MVKAIGYTVKTFLDIFFPIECLGCARYNVWICDRCLGQIGLAKTQHCPGCGIENPSGNRCLKCAARHYPIDGLVGATAYKDPLVREAIATLKYRYVRSIAPLLGELMLEQFMRHGLDERWWVMVPVPLNKRRLRQRGFNQSELLAEALRAKTGIPTEGALARGRATCPQVDLQGEDRKENVKDAFICIDPRAIEGRRVLLIDDVATTGSTLRECAKALKQAGSHEVWGLVVAKGG